MKKLLFIFLALCLSSSVFADMSRYADTDAMTGYGASSSTDSYNTARAKSYASLTADATVSKVGQQYLSSTWYLFRQLCRFDTSPFSDTQGIDSVLVKANIATDGSTTDFNLMCVATTDTSTTTHFNTGKFNEIKNWTADSTAYTPVALSDEITTVGKAVNDTLIFRFTAAGIDSIKRTGVTQFVIMSKNDYGCIAPTGNESLTLTDDSIWMEIYYHTSAEITGRYGRVGHNVNIARGEKW